MMGRREDDQVQFLYAFDLDKVVPSDHLVRQIDAILDLSWAHRELRPYYSHTGRPSIDPVLMIRMLLVGYVFALRSERRLCSEVQVNLAHRWVCKLSVEDKIPDHSVFSRARHERFRESDALRRVFEGVVAMCIAAGLVGGEAVSGRAGGRRQQRPARRCSDEPDTNASERAMLYGVFLRAWWQCASRLGSWAAKRFRAERGGGGSSARHVGVRTSPTRTLPRERCSTACF